MGLVLVCPRCEAKVLLQAQKCPHCEADLRDLPQEQRRYLIGRPGPPPVAESIKVQEESEIVSPPPGAEMAPLGGTVAEIEPGELEKKVPAEIPPALAAAAAGEAESVAVEVGPSPEPPPVAAAEALMPETPELPPEHMEEEEVPVTEAAEEPLTFGAAEVTPAQTEEGGEEVAAAGKKAKKTRARKKKK